MPGSRETRYSNSICVFLVLLSGIVRLISNKTHLFVANGIIFALFSSAIILWSMQIRRRILQPEVKRYLTCAVVLMIFWMLIRTIKYELLIPGGTASRYIWYLYYVPMLWIPLFLLLAVSYIGKPTGWHTSDKRRLLYVMDMLLVCGILTNDWHQLAFRFPEGLANWDNDMYIYGPVYYGAMGWLGILFIVMIVTAFIRCCVSSARERIWIPAIPALCGLIYILFNVFKCDNLITQMLRAPEIGSFLFAAFMESLICAHLFPSNDHYGALWKASDIGAGIMDREGNICFASEKSLPVTIGEVERALTEDVMLDNGTVSLKSHVIHGGYGYWNRDISQIHRLNKELEQLGDLVARENELLKAENEMEQQRLHLQEQNRLYDELEKSVRKQSEQLGQILGALPEDESAFEHSMKHACILNVYIKRHANLQLLCCQNARICSEELWRSVTESLEYVQLYGIRANGLCQGKGDLPGEHVLFAYELFEAVLENSLSAASDFLVYLECVEQMLTLRIEVHTTQDLLETDWRTEDVKKLRGTLELETDEDTVYISLSFPRGGDGP